MEVFVGRLRLRSPTLDWPMGWIGRLHDLGCDCSCAAGLRHNRDGLRSYWGGLSVGPDLAQVNFEFDLCR